MTTGGNACENCSSTDCSAKTQQPEEDFDSFMQRQAFAEKMCKIKHKVLVLSGKGGVGKSTVAVNLAVSLAQDGFQVGLLDVDFHGPSVTGLLKSHLGETHTTDGSLRPAEISGLKVLSIGMLLQKRDEAIIWRGPMKYGVIEQLLRDVEWGELDYLIIDSPPGTGDEPLSVCQLIDKPDGAVIVTTPQEVALADVRRSITFCHKLNLPVLGVVENMSGFICPKCGEQVDIFKRGGGEEMAREQDLPFLGRIPLDPLIVEAGDAGAPRVREDKGSPSAGILRGLADSLRREIEKKESHADVS